jgi:TorA maturation chaperone TorD
MIPHTLTNLTREQFNDALESVGCPVVATGLPDEDVIALMLEAFVWLAKRQKAEAPT